MSLHRLIELARALLSQVLLLEQAADHTVARYFKQHPELGPRERRTLADTVYAVLRRKTLFEWLAGGDDEHRLRRLALLGLAVPRSALWPLLRSDEQAWLQACDARAAGDLPEACQHNLPPWLAARLRRQLGADFDAAAAALLQPAPLDLRVNSLRQKRSKVRVLLQAQGVESEPTPWSPWGLRLRGKPALQHLDLYQQGAVEVQDEGSQLLALLVAAGRGQMVADFCAGAGGKTLALGAAMRDSGRLYALDVSAGRLQILKERVKRSGLNSVYTLAMSSDTDPRLQRLHGKMDRVLVDAPCSGLGTLRRSPDLKWRQPESAVAEFAATQTNILQRAAALVRPGGRLVYATCSLLAEENERIAAEFTAAHPEFEVRPVSQALSDLKLSSAEHLCTADGRYLRLWPHRHDTDGFFAALWQRC